MNRDTCRVNLNVRWVSEVSTLAIALDSCCTVTTHSVCRKEVSVTITTGSNNYGVGRETLQLTCNQILSDDTTSVTVNDNKILHLVTGEELNLTCLNHAAQRRVSTEEELLTCLTLSIESTRYLSTTERTVSQHTTVLTSERNALSYALVDDVVAHLSQTVNVSLTSTVVTTLYCIVEQTVNRIAVILIILSCIDTTLCCDRVSTTWRVLDAEVQDIEAHLAERSSSRSTCQTCTYNDDVEL